MSEQGIVFDSAGARLAGTLTIGEEPRRSACVLLIPGSGQVDRNENHQRLRINVLGELAGWLAERGIDSLRYDKRGVGESEGDFWAAGLADNAADVSAAVEFIRSNEVVGGEKVFLLGHSEGAYLATIVTARTPEIAGVILLAGGARSCEAELKWQAQQVAASMSGFNGLLIKLLHIDVVKAQQKQLDKIRRSREDWYRVQLVAKVNAKWMREFLEYDPSGDLAKICVPILAITGSKDIQVDPGNLDKMTALVTAPFEHHVVPDVTHILRADPGPPSLSTYRDQAKRPVDPEVVGLILGWMERQTGSSA
jgi:pimeloyl-ACP methyl ester carboxylesterase